MSLVDLFRQLAVLIGLPAVLLAGAAAAMIVIARDWRLVIASYALLSVMLALLLARVVPTQWALLQAIAGGLIAVMLYLSARQLRWNPDSGRPREAQWPRVASLTSFRTLAVGLAAVTFFVIRDNITLPGFSTLFRDALLWLVLLGLLGLALHEEPLHAGLCLLTVWGGVELLLFSLTQQRLLVGILTGGQVLLGLAVSYLVLAHGLPAEFAETDAAQAQGGEP